MTTPLWSPTMIAREAFEDDRATSTFTLIQFGRVQRSWVAQETRGEGSARTWEASFSLW